MKRLKGIYSAVLVICAILLAASCEKRPLLDLSNTHYVRVYVDENLLNVTKGFYDESYEKPAYKSPGILRVTLTDPESGIVKAERYLRDQGYDEKGRYYEGYIIADPGEYQLMAYNFDTESTIIGSSNNRYEINAYTNPIASHLYTKIPSRVKSQTDESKGEKLSKIVYDPDHLFVADCGSIRVPYVEHVDTLKTPEGRHHFEAESIVKSYFMRVKVKGAQYISSAVSLLEGMVGSTMLSNKMPKEEDPVTLYLEMLAAKDKERLSNDEVYIYTTFGMFGRHEGEDNTLEVTFDFITTYGVPYNITFDIASDFNKPEAINHQWLLLDYEIEIPPPPPGTGNGDGGFKPSVDEWDDVQTDIII